MDRLSSDQMREIQCYDMMQFVMYQHF